MFPLTWTTNLKPRKYFRNMESQKPNSVEKYSVILQSAVILKAESMLDEQTRAMMQVMKIDPFADLRTHINEKDYNVVAANSQAVFKAIKDVDDYTASTLSAVSPSDDKFDEDYLISAYQEVSPDAYDDSDEKLKEDVKKKYNTKKKFKGVKDKYKTENIIIQPSDITFSNSSEAEAYAELYTGVAGEWVMVSSCGYLGTHNGNKAFYTWGSGGVLVYSKFPIDMDTCAPDKFIPDEEVTPAIAKKTVLQMYKCGD